MSTDKPHNTPAGPGRDPEIHDESSPGDSSRDPEHAGVSSNPEHASVSSNPEHAGLGRDPETYLDRLRHSFRTRKRKHRTAALLLFLAVLLTGFSLLALIESSQYLSPVVKTGIWTATLLVASGTLWAAWALPEKSARSFTRFYRQFCEANNLQKLEDALDLYLDPQKVSPFHDLAVKRNLDEVDPQWVDTRIREFNRRNPIHRLSLVAAVIFLASLLAATGASWSFPDAADRSLNMLTAYEKPNPHHFAIVPGDTTLEHGSYFEPEIRFEEDSPLPGEVTLAFRTDVEEEFRYRSMRQSGERSWLANPFELTENTQYRVVMDRFQSETHRVELQLRPRFESLTVEVDPPSYTGLAATSIQYPFARVSAFGGSTVRIEGRTNKPVDKMVLMFGEEEIAMSAEDADPAISAEGADDADPTIRAEVADDTDPVLGTEAADDADPVLGAEVADDAVTSTGTHWAAEFELTREDTIRFSMRDKDGLTNRNPFQFTTRLMNDEPPVVTILYPEDHLTLAEPRELEILYQASDDFGLTDAELNWRLQRAFRTDVTEGSKELGRPQMGEFEESSLDLRDLDLRPRDRLTFWVTVWDNDAFSGFKKGESGRITVEIPSVSAQLEEIDEGEQRVQETLDDISERFRQMDQEYRQFRERLQENPEPDWEEEQMLEDIIDRQDEIDNSVSRLNEQFEELSRQMEQSGQVSDETRRAYRELQNMMDQLDDPDLRRALDELRRSMDELSPQQIQQALENFEFNEQVYRERLERTLELFKMLKMNSDLDRLAAQYDDMAERMQQAVEEQDPEEQSSRHQGVREDTEGVDRQLERIDEQPPRRAEEQLREMKNEARQELHQIQEELDRLIEEQAGRQESTEDGDGDPDDFRQRQEQLGQQFENRAQALRQARQQMSGQSIQINLLALQQSLYSLLELSNSQEELTQMTGQIQSQSQGFVELARIQRNINQQFSSVADTLFQISAEVPALSNNINRQKVEVERTISRSVDQLADRNQRNSVIASRESLGGINRLASMIAGAIDQLMDQQGEGAGSGEMSLQQMIEQMQQMSQDQQMMNQQIQDLINDVQGERLTREQSERLDQLARQQNEIRRQLQELQRSGALREGDRALSELQRMAEQMEEAINDMRGGLVDPLMNERQQNILSRMLEAEEALQQRGEEEDDYAGRTPEDFERAIPPDITLEELRQEIRNRLQDPQYSRFRDTYQELIERYFERLRQIEDGVLP